MISSAFEARIKRFEAGEGEGLFLLHGEEEFLVEEAGRELLARLAPEGGVREVKMIAGGKGEAERIVAEMCALSFFTPQLVLLVRNSELFGEANDRESEAFLAWFQKNATLPHPIVFTVYDRKGDRGRVDKRRRVYKAVDKRGLTHEYRVMKPEDAGAWVRFRLRQAGKEAEPEAVRLLVERTGVSLGPLANEIEKMVLYAGEEKRVDRETVEALVGPSREEAIWDLTDHVLASNPARALRDLSRLIDRSGENPLGILMWLAREFRSLLEARALLGHPRARVRGALPANPAAIQSGFIRTLSADERAALIQEGFSFLAMHPWAASMRLASAHRFGERKLRDGLVTIAAAERALKMSAGRARAILEETLLSLAAPEGAS